MTALEFNCDAEDPNLFRKNNVAIHPPNIAAISTTTTVNIMQNVLRRIPRIRQGVDAVDVGCSSLLYCSVGSQVSGVHNELSLWASGASYPDVEEVA